MTAQDRDYEDSLRRALAAAAESIEPTGDGLQRIRHRLDSPRSPRSVFSGFARWLDLHTTRLLVRLDPAIEAGRSALRRTGPLSGLLLALAGLFRPRGRRRAGGHRGRGSQPGRLGPAGPWLKPVFAVSAAVAIVVVGVVVLNHETQTLISPTNDYGPPSAGSSLHSGGTTANSKRWKLPLGVSLSQPPSGPGGHKDVTGLLPAVACTPTPKPVVTTTAPAPATATPTPSVTGTASSSPTPQPTQTSPSPTATPTGSPATGGGGTATAAAAAMVAPENAVARTVVECGTTLHHR